MADSDLPIGVMNTCASCGVQFALHKDVETVWRGSHKAFVCPNGHNLAWSDKTPQEKELDALRARVKELEAQLVETKQKLEQESVKNTNLATRLELWEPSK